MPKLRKTTMTVHGRGASRRASDRGMVRRLKDQLTVQKRIAAIHANPRLLHEMAFYPVHDKRRETPQYKKVHEHLTKELDLPCLVCGVRNSTLKTTRENPYRAKAMETHHHLVEWSLANAIDPARFSKTILPHLRARHPDNPDYQKTSFDAQDVANWVDHSAENLWVLCDVHHRARYFGIHEITYPLWCPMDLLLPSFEQYVMEQIASLKSQPPKSARRKPRK